MTSSNLHRALKLIFAFSNFPLPCQFRDISIIQIMFQNKIYELCITQCYISRRKNNFAEIQDNKLFSFLPVLPPAFPLSTLLGCSISISTRSRHEKRGRQRRMMREKHHLHSHRLLRRRAGCCSRARVVQVKCPPLLLFSNCSVFVSHVSLISLHSHAFRDRVPRAPLQKQKPLFT